MKLRQVLEEIHCIAKAGGSTRRLDMLAYNELTKEGVVIDPTITFELTINQPQDFNNEIRKIYESCVDYYLFIYFQRIVSIFYRS